jgi:hypothetical protein
MGCAYDKCPIPQYNVITGETYERFLPKIWIDFALRIRPVKGEKIDITKIVSFILNLRNKGFPIKAVTFDGYQSAMAIQVIQKAGQLPQYRRYAYANRVINLEANVLSVDRTDIPYTVLRDCLNYNTINMYRYQPFIDEVLTLEHDIEKKKVDHPEGGSKDVADAVCGVVYNIAVARTYIPMDPINDMSRFHGTSIEESTLGSIMPDHPEGNIIGIEPAPMQPQVTAPRPLCTGLQALSSKMFGRYLK